MENRPTVKLNVEHEFGPDLDIKPLIFIGIHNQREFEQRDWNRMWIFKGMLCMICRMRTLYGEKESRWKT